MSYYKNLFVWFRNQLKQWMFFQFAVLSVFKPKSIAQYRLLPFLASILWIYYTFISSILNSQNFVYVIAEVFSDLLKLFSLHVSELNSFCLVERSVRLIDLLLIRSYECSQPKFIKAQYRSLFFFGFNSLENILSFLQF